MRKPNISDPKCAASENTAIDPANQPPYNSAAINIIEMKTAKTSFFIAALVSR
jgi:hypothetical protein